jgi:luciferase family oxidoreductase group 1
MRISILDQAPIAGNETAREALMNCVKLAQAGEELGYTRYWIAEHHDLPGLACSAPEVVLGYIGAKTNTIRIGPGAVLLPHYKPYKVAEVYNTLATLFPSRVDIGIGRAPGGAAEAANALSDNFLQQVWKMPDLVSDLLHFLEDDFQSGNDHAKLSASPLPEVQPVPWLLGTGRKSAILAAENGLSYAFGQFMSEKDGHEITKQYREGFKPRKKGDSPEVILTVSSFCAETSEKAEEIALSSMIWSLSRGKGSGIKGLPSIEEAKTYILSEEDKQELARMKEKLIIGNPEQVKEKLLNLKLAYQADEMMIVTITHSLADKITSYKLIAEALKS